MKKDKRKKDKEKKKVEEKEKTTKEEKAEEVTTEKLGEGCVSNDIPDKTQKKKKKKKKKKSKNEDGNAYFPSVSGNFFHSHSLKVSLMWRITERILFCMI